MKAGTFISVIKPYTDRSGQEIIEDVKHQIGLVLGGDLTRPQAMLAGHAEALDALFYNLLSQAQRSKDPEVVGAFLSAAVKAQEGCRSAAEGLATIKQLTSTSQ
ncbi:MAG: hypothetical protein ACRER8_22210 [Pseudomonas sp.]|uniref:hypothetical protein n=1 Tax=Pseudomonas sp. TaxID=306 RepID=UPI003D6EE97E